MIGVGSDWTLFLDRDGVINQRIIGDYIKTPEDFHFLEGVLEAIPLLNQYFKYIIIVTNQAGVGKGLMSRQDLDQIHKTMLKTIESHGGKINAVLSCTDLATTLPNCRKPGKSLAFQACQLFPDIDLNKSVMVGDEITDMVFGRHIGAVNIFIDHGYEHLKEMDSSLYDERYDGLKEFERSLSFIF